MKKRSNKRFANRSPGLFDLIQRFEAKSSQTHTSIAKGAIESLWQESNEFRSHKARLLQRTMAFAVADSGALRFNLRQDLATALRGFIAEFEHSARGMVEMLYGTSENARSDPNIRRIQGPVDTHVSAITPAAR